MAARIWLGYAVPGPTQSEEVRVSGTRPATALVGHGRPRSRDTGRRLGTIVEPAACWDGPRGSRDMLRKLDYLNRHVAWSEPRDCDCGMQLSPLPGRAARIDEHPRTVARDARYVGVAVDDHLGARKPACEPRRTPAGGACVVHHRDLNAADLSFEPLWCPPRGQVGAVGVPAHCQHAGVNRELVEQRRVGDVAAVQDELAGL